MCSTRRGDSCKKACKTCYKLDYISLKRHQLKAIWLFQDTSFLFFGFFFCIGDTKSIRLDELFTE